MENQPKPKKEMRHPLLNRHSPHYDHQETTGIEQLESRYSVDYAIGWSELNIFKYRLRQDHKGEKSSDLKKIETYKAYLSLLRDMKRLANVGQLDIKVAYRMLGIEMIYKF